MVAKGHDPKGVRPETDARSVTDLIAMLEVSASEIADDDVRSLLQTWCQAARSGYIIRHNIAHGVAGKVESTLVFSRNPRWHGEVRKREFGDLWCDTYTLDLIRESFATLLRIVLRIIANDNGGAGEGRQSTVASGRTRSTFYSRRVCGPILQPKFRKIRKNVGRFRFRLRYLETTNIGGRLTRMATADVGSVCKVVRDALTVGREVPADAPGDPCRGVLDRVPRQMRVAGGRLHLRVTQQLPDHREAFAERQRSRSIAEWRRS